MRGIPKKILSVALVSIVAALAGAGPVPVDIRVNKDEAQLKGDWVFVSAKDSNGKIEMPSEMIWNFDKERHVVTITAPNGGRAAPQVVAFKIEQAGFCIMKYPGGKAICGIYRISGDTLQICIARTGDGTRPIAFAPRAEDNSVVSTYRRMAK